MPTLVLIRHGQSVWNLENRFTGWVDVPITPLGADAAMILGHWELEREKDRPGGIFTLVARRFPEGWRIIHDHTSAVSEAPMQK